MTVTLTAGQYKHLQQLSDDNNIISALAIDQRGSLKKDACGSGQQAC